MSRLPSGQIKNNVKKTLSISPYLLAVIGAIYLLCWGCKDPYVSPYKSPSTGYLVVEGYISGNTTTKFTLTRTLSLPGDSTLPTVSGANVQIEGSDNSVHPLTGLGAGVYSSIDTLSLNPQLQYRLRISIPSGEQYLSDFVPYKTTPPIDSINWIQKSDNTIQIYANSHDPADNTHYYQWDYDQTYEYHSAEASNFYYDKDTTPVMVLARDAEQQIYRCWTTSNSTNILIASSTKLAQDVIYEQPIKLIPADDIQTSVLYSIHVREYALTAGGYNFLSLMQKNSESLGSIFDAQPTQITGNIHSLSNPAEEIIGYVSAGSVQQQRIFIYRSQIVTHYVNSCPAPDTTLPQDIKSLEINFGSGVYTPLYFGTSCGRCALGWVSNFTDCVNCLLGGGTNVDPSFWPN